MERSSVDHLGNKFPSIREMCDHYGVNVHTFYSRTLYGASVEEALTKPVRGKEKKEEVTGNAEERNDDGFSFALLPFFPLFMLLSGLNSRLQNAMILTGK